MRTIIASFAAFLIVASPAFAQTTQPAPTAAANCSRPSAHTVAPSAELLAARQAERQICAADMARFCGNVPHGCGRPMQCLRAHRAELSTGCAGAMTQLHAVHAQAR